MIKNYFKIAWRNLSRNRSHSLINLLGLAIGIACCLLILLWVVDELSYDQWNEKSDRIYRVAPEVNFGGAHRHFALSPAPLAGALRSDFPEVETAVRFWNPGTTLVKRDVQNFKESNTVFVDSTLFDVFSLKLIKGDPGSTLAPPNTMIINETTAKKYFPNEDPLGKTLIFNDQLELKVSGVIEDMPLNSHFNFDFFVSLSGIDQANEGMWVSHNFCTYYVLREGVDHANFEAKVYPHLIQKYIGPQIEQLMGKPFEEFEKSGAFLKYHFQALKDIHLKSDLEYELGANSNIQYVWIFSIAALFILLIACVNFMNLSTARSASRAKEIGLRKVMGSLRSQLIKQFLTESLLMVGLAFILGIGMAQFALPYYNELADKSLSLPFASTGFWSIAFLSTVAVGFIAGSYPAFYLSGFKPIKTITGKLRHKAGNLNLRNGLVVFQFLIAVLLIIGTLVIQQQMNYIQNKKLGYEREQVLLLDDTHILGEQTRAFKDELLTNPKISSVSVSGYLPVPSNRNDSPLCKSPEIREDNCVSIQMWNIDQDYLATMGMELVAGRNFSDDMPTDSNAVIINETAAKILGFDNPIGKKLFGGAGSIDRESGSLGGSSTIIGVVKDFHFESLRQNIGALSFWLQPSNNHISIKANSDQIATLIPEIESSWKAMAPGQPFNFRFLDESFDRLYRSETRISSIFGIFSGLSIFIACLGLFGLAAFATERRTKEIGIRKVLGATTANLVALISKDFLRLVVIAMVIAIPIAWYFMNQWLQDFAYRVNIQWWIFFIAGILAIAIAFATVSLQSIRAALANPVDSLRSE